MIVAIKCNKALFCGFGASLIFLLFLSVPVTLLGEKQGTIVVSGGTLIDGNGGPPLQNAIVVIQDGKFSQVGRVGEVTIPANSQVIDASGKTILPGFEPGAFGLRAQNANHCARVMFFDDPQSDQAWLIFR